MRAGSGVGQCLHFSLTGLLINPLDVRSRKVNQTPVSDFEEMELDFSSDERRIEKRTVLNMPATVLFGDGRSLTAQSVDISRSGMGLFSQHVLPVGEECTVQVDLSACGTDFELKIVGKVCYCRTHASGQFRAGLQFVRMPAETAALMRSLM
jgi:hypothetical protein